MSKIQQLINETLVEFSEPKLPYKGEIQAIGNSLHSGQIGMLEWLEMLANVYNNVIDDEMSLEEVNAIDKVFRRELIKQLS